MGICFAALIITSTQTEIHLASLKEAIFKCRGQSPLWYLTNYCSLILEPTGLRRGQFQRIGVVLHAHMWGVTDINAFLHKARNPELLEDAFCQEADPDLGFTVEIN
jgi:hypothetical protein